MTEQEAFRFGFLLRCAQEGVGPDLAEKRAAYAAPFLIGSTIHGAASAPSGHRGEGAWRGAHRGIKMELGSLLGGTAGGLGGLAVGGLGGAAIGGLASAATGGHVADGAALGGGLGAGVGGMGGLLAGTAGGVVAGYNHYHRHADKPSWEKDKESDRDHDGIANEHEKNEHKVKSAEFDLLGAIKGIGIGGLAAAAGVGGTAGYAIAKAQERPVDPAEIRRHELIAAYNSMGDRVRLNRAGTLPHSLRGQA